LILKEEVRQVIMDKQDQPDPLNLSRIVKGAIKKGPGGLLTATNLPVAWELSKHSTTIKFRNNNRQVFKPRCEELTERP